jgi:hypothetical protein
VSTNDVPGAKADNRDVLAMGCWAEHEDGSMILVESVEAGTVVYSIFDMAKDPVREYRDAINEWDFKQRFSYDPLAKTAFPWDTVMEDFPSGEKHASANAEITAAQRIADSLKLRAEPLRERITRPNREQQPATTIMNRIHAAIEAFAK